VRRAICEEPCAKRQAKSKMQNARCKKQDARCKMQDARSKMQDARCKMHITSAVRVKSTRCRGYLMFWQFWEAEWGIYMRGFKINVKSSRKFELHRVNEKFSRKKSL
jgi:hypothetical protein